MGNLMEEESAFSSEIMLVFQAESFAILACAHDIAANGLPGNT
jgi:hypothetical protein